MSEPNGANAQQGDNGNANANINSQNSNEPDKSKEGAKDFEKLYNDSQESIQGLEGTNSRLLEESKKHKTQKEKAQEDLLIEQGKKDELIQTLRDRIKISDQKEEDQNVATAISLEAQKRKCDDWDFLYNLADTKMIKHDPDTGAVTGIKEFFDNAQKNERFTKFFSKEQHVDTDSNPPGFTPPAGPETIDYRKNPLAYLEACTKISQEKRHEAILKLKAEGLIK